MNEQLTIGQADTWFTQAENFFAAHPIAKWLFLAWLFGWMVAFIVRLLIRKSPLPDSLESKLVVLASVAASGGAAHQMWDGDYPLIVATIIAGTSIPVYIGLAAAACWKWPSLKPRLSLLKDFSAAVEDETGDDLPPPKP
jgi:hypothetical protein